MCTAVAWQSGDLYFGRTLDYERSFGEEVVITPRNYPLSFCGEKIMPSHYAIIGMAHAADGYPLYYDAVNEKGVAAAGLNFVGYAVYHDPIPTRKNIAHFDLIPWVLSQCGSVQEAKELLPATNITGIAFNGMLKPAKLHWIIADKEESIVVESVADGLRIYHNPAGVLTNNPPFPQQLFQLNNYLGLSPKEPENRFSDKLDLQIYSRGMGALGLPGDLSSQSRFVRATFTKLHAAEGKNEKENVGQFFHILDTVAQTDGCCILEEGSREKTIYTSCCNVNKGIYYYTTYENRQITAIDLYHSNLDSDQLSCFVLKREEEIRFQNI